MNLHEIGNLLEKISVHYPSFRKHISDEYGHMSRNVAEEWMRIIGYLEYNEALDRLDEHMMGPDGGKAPKPMDLRKIKPAKKSEEWHAPIEHVWHLEFSKWDVTRMHGRLFDQEDREYVHDPVYEDGYHYDQQGRICTIDGRVVYQ